MDLSLNSALFQSSFLSVLNLIILELDPKVICLSMNYSRYDLDLTFEVPSIVLDCNNDYFLEIYKKGVDQGCFVHVISNDCALTLLDNFRTVQDHLVVNFLIKYLIILNLNEDFDGLALFEHPTIVEDLPETLILENNNDSIDIHYYWNQDGLQNKYFIENNSLLYERPLFYKENGLDLGGREMKVSLVVYTPFSYAGFNASNELQLDGTDVYLVQEFCKIYNCSLSYKFFYEGEVYGIIYENFTGTGIFGATGSRQSHLSIGAPYTTIFLNPYTILSTPTQQSRIINLVPIPQPLSYSKTPLLPFPADIWGYIAIAYSLGIVALFCAQKVSNSNKNKQDHHKSPLGDAFFNVLMISLFQSMGLHQVFGSHACIILLLLFFSLILGTLYDGGFASVMTVTRYEKPISTIYDIVESKSKWKGLTIAYLYPVELTQDPNLRKYIDNFIVVPLTDMHKQDHTTDIFLTEYTQNRALANLNNLLDHKAALNYMVSKQELCAQYTSVISHKTWPYMEYMNNLIRAVTESGIREHWEYEVINNVMDYSIQRIVDENNHYTDKNNEPVSITVEHIMGAVIILIAGHLLAFVIFVIEILSHRFKRHRA